MNTLLSGQLISFLTLFLGGGVGVALVAAWTNRRLNAATVEEKRVATADKITAQAAAQFTKALERIEKLEAKNEVLEARLSAKEVIERSLVRRVYVLERALREAGYPIPPVDAYEDAGG